MDSSEPGPKASASKTKRSQKTPQNLGTISYDEFLEGIQLIPKIWNKHINPINPQLPGTTYLSYSNILNHETGLINVTYHIIYSQSYQVPVLYFNYSFSSGKLLSITEISNLISTLSGNRDMEAEEMEMILENISQQEHPLLNTPFYYFHPCHTNSLMEGLEIPNPQDYLLSWLSIVSNYFSIPNNGFL